MALRGGRDDLGSPPMGELDGEAAHAARGSVDQDPIAAREVRLIEERLPRRQARQRHRCGLDMIQRFRLGRQIGCAHRDVLGCCTIPPEVQQPIDRIPVLQIGSVGGNLLHGPRDLEARDDRTSVVALVVRPRRVPGQLRRRDGGGVYLDQRVAVTEARFRCLFIPQCLGSSAYSASNGVHGRRSILRVTCRPPASTNPKEKVVLRWAGRGIILPGSSDRPNPEISALYPRSRRVTSLMSRLAATLFVSLDGVVESPEKWSFPFWDDAIGKFKHEETFGSDALLLGRVTYEGFAAAWPGRKDPDGFADRFNSMPKYVASRTLKKLEWNNSHLIKGDLATEVSKLKERLGQDIVIHGSPTLIRSLLPSNLIDEFRLLVYPLVLGHGKRLFDEASQADLKLTESQAFSKGVVKLVYRPTAKSRKTGQV